MTQPRMIQPNVKLAPPPRQRRTWLNLREAMSTWPSLSVTVKMLPWQWRIWFWNDWDCTLSWTVDLGPLKIDFYANKPMFVLDA